MKISERMLDWLVQPKAPEALPVRLGRRRVYVMPTSAGILLGAILGGCTIAGINYNSNSTLMVGLVMLAAGIISLIACHNQLEGVQVTQVDCLPAHAGDTMTVLVYVKAQRCQRGLFLRCGASYAEAAIDERGEGMAKIEVPATQRGRWSLPRLGLITRRPFGLSTAWAWVWPKYDDIIVWPELESNPPHIPSGGTGNKSSTQAGDTFNDVRSLREYRQGDSLKQISWKHSARRGRVVVREYENPAGHAVIDWNELGHIPVETRLSRMATWVVEAERSNRATCLILPGKKIGPQRGPAHKKACLDALAEMPQ